MNVLFKRHFIIIYFNAFDGNLTAGTSSQQQGSHGQRVVTANSKTLLQGQANAGEQDFSINSRMSNVGVDSHDDSQNVTCNDGNNQYIFSWGA